MQIPSVSAAMPSSAASSQGQAALTSDFQTFIEMLTAQAENQDPLNPMDSAEYASQLASFSSVEQQVLTNDLLTALTNSMGASNLAQLSNWVGMDARTSAPVMFDGAPLTLHPLPARLADEAEIVVYDLDGNEVQRFDVATDGEPVEWAGVDENGDPFPADQYQFVMENFAEGTTLGTTPVETYQTVEEAQMIDGEIILLLAGGQPVRPADVIGIRQ